jgi:hypothetical protein
MGSAIAEVVPLAMSMVLVNALPAMAVILMLLSPRGMATASTFAVGWVVGLIVAFAILLFAISPDDLVGDASDPSPLSSIVRMVLGGALLVMAYRQWRGRPQPGEELAAPAWMASLDRASPVTTLGLGAFASGPNPKNLAFTIAAVVAIAQAELTTREKLAPVASYILLASAGIVGPVLWRAVAEEQATRTLARWRDWLAANYATVMAVVLLLFGVTLVAKGLGGLLG